MSNTIIIETAQLTRDLVRSTNRPASIMIRRAGQPPIVVEAKPAAPVRRPAVDPRPDAQQVKAIGKRALKRIKRKVRRAVRHASKETLEARGHRTQESTAPVAQRPAQPPAAQRPADALLSPAVAGAGLAGAYWRDQLAGRPLEMPLEAFTSGRGPMPYGGETPWTVPADTAAKA